MTYVPPLWERSRVEDLPSIKRATAAVYLVTKIERRHGRPFGDDNDGEARFDPAIEVYRRFRRMSLAEADAGLLRLRAELARAPAPKRAPGALGPTMMTTADTDLLAGLGLTKGAV